MIYLLSLSQPYFVIVVTFRVNNYNSYPKQDYNSQNVEVSSPCKLKLTIVGEQTYPYVEISQYPFLRLYMCVERPLLVNMVTPMGSWDH